MTTGTAPGSTAPGTGAAVYHPGERAVQRRAGATEAADHAGRSVRATVPPVAAAFLAERRMVVLGAADTGGRVWATALTGPPGFVRAAGEQAVALRTRPRPGDPLAEPLATGPVRVGAIAVEPATRRRMRFNGTARPDGAGLLVTTEQVYSNCPKYIQRRTVTGERAPVPGGGPPPVRGDALDERQRRLVTEADTFFVATAAADGSADASHRGGEPGFVRVPGPDRLCWPEYAGNSMYMTLGNLAQRPAAGLLFPDWSTGGFLQLTGEARVDWSAGRAAAVPGALRMVDFTVTGVVEVPYGDGPCWSAPESSPANPPAR
ncbi:pyridoxamine 5'-phosphate oxidase family protein [Streptomyces sp. TRM 70361]|uniref:pyridoxamine 5'-phosphate oxidase family protein n=1 Tax=Streptomyces sp. TRM 70361 TaxID=3116553 RepID=UPI002E7B9822|nr:pyridoxamine 5'-phosphate oxidase family protein [Streptomyces sp. TRM 70361]MEE1939478.1 pyridoxamine 5'-phosphate oxidase family protein [Streptomyces sp. TRM 70361]